MDFLTENTKIIKFMNRSKQFDYEKLLEDY